MPTIIYFVEKYDIENMAIESFTECLKLETQEQLDKIMELIEAADASLPDPPSDILERIDRGIRLVEEGFFDI